MELITELDIELMGTEVSYKWLSQKIDAFLAATFLAATYDLVEKLNEFDYDRHKILFARHQKIANEIKTPFPRPRRRVISHCVFPLTR
ncbi:MAG: hypothetical protein ACUVQV_05555 [Dissulfurimicrobium sp.]|uniref:hypothetical protein n=1 Tax=Dissulfurimicrobium sp. TaxID=2022436 RepID=UPI00404A167C